MKKMGLRESPWGTPMLVMKGSEISVPIHILNFTSSMRIFIMCSSSGGRNSVSISTRFLLLTVSKAFDISNMSSVTL